MNGTPAPSRATSRTNAYGDAARIGVLLGAVLLASFVIAGRGLGASGAFADVAGRALEAIAPATRATPAIADRLPSDGSLADSWILWQVAGVALGALLSARLAGRIGTTSRGDDGARTGRALAGGALMGVGARLAYGCTSGLGLSGGAMLATGAWLFIAVAFATALLVAFVARRGMPRRTGEIA